VRQVHGNGVLAEGAYLLPAGALRTGGPANGNHVTAVWFQAGKTFADSGRNYLLTRFEQ
jgi:hypothetical protein